MARRKGDAIKHRILYVDRRSGSDRRPGFVDERLDAIVGGLRRSYDVDFRFGLDDSIESLIKDSLSAQPYEALITHVPRNPVEDYELVRLPYLASYLLSLVRIAGIKKTSDIPIVAYTGAPPKAHGLIRTCGADAVILKSSSPDKDVEQLVEAVRRLLGEYKKDASRVPPLEIRREGGDTVVEVAVNVPCGVGWIGLGEIVRRCGRYPGSVVCSKIGEAGKADMKNISALMKSRLAEGTRIRIEIQGDGPEAERLARELCSAFSMRYEGLIEFPRDDGRDEKG